MNKQIITALLALMSHCATAQEVFYFANGSAYPGSIVEADEASVKYYQQNGDRKIIRRTKHDNIVAIFNAKGNYLTIDEILKNSMKSKAQLNNFYREENSFKTDILIKAKPVRAIAALITYENDVVINYCNAEGEASSIPKSDLLGIVRKEGRFDFLASNADISFLKDKETAKKIKAILVSGAETKCKIQTPPVKKEDSLTIANKQFYRQKSLEKVEQFVQYLNIVADKKLTAADRKRAIDQAVKMFVPDATMQVNTKNSIEVKSYPIREYLTRLSNLEYEKVSIVWNDIRFANNFTKQSDGSYQGRVVASQTFTGSGKNKNYTDFTKKSALIRLESFDPDPDDNQKKWQVLMGSVGIEVF